MASDDLDRFLREPEVATLTGFSVHTLRHWRAAGQQDQGPPWRKIGRAVVYSEAALRAWMADPIGSTATTEACEVRG